MLRYKTQNTWSIKMYQDTETRYFGKKCLIQDTAGHDCRSASWINKIQDTYLVSQIRIANTCISNTTQVCRKNRTKRKMHSSILSYVGIFLSESCCDKWQATLLFLSMYSYRIISKSNICHFQTLKIATRNVKLRFFRKTK